MIDWEGVVFLPFKLVGGKTDSVRLDFIAEVVQRKANSTPYHTIGSTLFLTTGREVDVVQTPVQVMEMMAWAWKRSTGHFDSEDENPELPIGLQISEDG